jgi:hypothetical protein
MAYSCSKGISSFAYDNIGTNVLFKEIYSSCPCLLIGAGRTIRPVNATDCQIITAGNVSSSLARGLKSGTVTHVLTGKKKPFEKVIGYGHSQGSATLNYAAISDGIDSPFDGLVLTGKFPFQR